MMDLTENLLRDLCQTVKGTTKIHYQGSEFDFGAPFRRLSVFDAILEYNPDWSAEAISDLSSARALAEALNIPVKDTWGLGKIQIELFEATVEERLEQPTFITEYPTEVSPLARRSDDNPEVTERLFGDKRDRKSTRLNSSHVAISYAVFCLKKKNHIYN